MTVSNGMGSSSESLASLGFDLALQGAIRITGEQGLAEPNYHNLGSDGAIWLARLVLNEEICTAVELGTSNGLSALFLGGALKQTGGQLTTYEEKHPERAALATEGILAANLSEVVSVVVSDGVSALAERTRPIDLLFMDIWPADYIRAIENARHILRPGSLVVADNLDTYRDRSGIARSAIDSGAPEYLKFIRAQPDCISDREVRGIGSGMLLTRIVEIS